MVDYDHPLGRPNRVAHKISCVRFYTGDCGWCKNYGGLYNIRVSWINQTIVDRGGAIPFAEYMDLALYHPQRGYYSQSTARYGRAGDFLTAPTASPWYSRVFAGILERLAGRCGSMVLVDLAAGDGSFLEATLAALGEGWNSVIKRVVAVEQSEAMRRCSENRIGAVSVVHAAKLADVGRPQGTVVLHASELYDALPVDRVIGGENGLVEFWVAVDGGKLVWEQRPARAEVKAYFDGHGVALAEGQVAESSRAAASLHSHHLEWAGRDALAFVLDYGYGSVRLYDPRGRAQGSLTCYHRHEMSRDPLVCPGEQDLTAHVNWDDLRNSALSLGWKENALWPLAEFLVRSGLADVVDDHGLGMEAELDAATYGARQEIKRLLDPEGMGADLKVLIQGKGPIARVAAEVFGL